MLIDISIKNYLSFKDKTTFSLRATSNKDTANMNIISLNDNINILRTSAIYWYNASWKTNFLKAIFFIRSLIVDSWRLWPNDPFLSLWWLYLQPFRLNITSQRLPAIFKIHFEIDSTLYTYEFSVTARTVHTEILSCKKTQKEKILFKRENQKIKIYDFDDNNSISRVNENNLALSIFAKEWSEEAKKIHKFFQEIYVFPWSWSLNDSEFMMQNEPETFKPFLKTLLTKADLWIEDFDFSLKEIPFDQLPKPEELKNQLKLQWIPIPDHVESHTWNTLHPIYDDNKKRVWTCVFWLQDESEWTNKILNLAWSIYDVIRNWKILFLDELDACLHTSLFINLIHSFNKVNTNSHYQIIFTTQDTHIIDIKKYLRRDQIWFVKKDELGISSLKRLSDEDIRKEYISEKNYYKWKFWGLNKTEESDLFDSNSIL